MRGELQPGQVIGRCTIRQRVGIGSMGIVYEAHHTTLDIDVAIKVLHDHAVGPEGAEWRQRLRREAQIAARLNHPGLVRVLDYGEDWGSPYIVMEFVRGQTLEQFLSDRVLLDENLALRIMGQVATGLHAAHEAGIVHRDIKPANLLIGSDGKVRIADLGLARDPHSAAITRPSGIAGTPHYMAPEALDAAMTPDHRVDIYALGVLLYRMVYGRLPYPGSLHQVLAGHLHGQPDWTPPEGVRISPGTLYLIRRLLEKWPARRLQSAVELVQGCRELLARLDGQRRMQAEMEKRTRSSSSSGTGTRFGRAIRGKLRLESDSSSGIKVVHATARERIIAWVFLLALALAAFQGLKGFPRLPAHAKPATGLQTGR